MRNQTKKTRALWLHRLAWFYICGVIPVVTILVILGVIHTDSWKLFASGLVISLSILTIFIYPVVLSSTKCYCDNFFVDRENERRTLMQFIKDSSERRRIFYVTGKKGIGKTLLLLRLANDLAKKKICTTVYYVEIEGKDSSILHKCLEMIGIPPDEKIGTAASLAAYLDQASRYPKIVFILDGIDRNRKRDADKFAEILTNSSKNISIIIGITIESLVYSQTITLYGNLKPDIFGCLHLHELEKVYNISITDPEKILRLSSGIPTYVRILIDLEHQNRALNLSNIETIDEIIWQQYSFFSNESKKIVMLMAYLKLMGVDSLPERKIYDIIPDSTPHHVCAVLDSSLIYRENDTRDGNIRMNDLVAESCRKCCNKNQAVEMIKNSHEHLENIFDGTLNVSLLMLSDTHFSEETGREILKNLLDGKQYLFLERLWQYEQIGYLNSSLKESHSNNQYFNYCYLNSLLQLGQYRRAYSELARLEEIDSALPTLRPTENMNAEDFDMLFLIIDLHHLSNRFSFAISEIDAFLQHLPKVFKNQIQEAKLLYLKAHILKHQGSDLLLADNILRGLDKNTNIQNLELQMKILYSRIAIYLFWDTSFDYEASFNRIDTLAKEIGESPVIMHAQRHRAIYTLKKLQDIESALTIVNNALRSLEKTQYRIIYDLYFEKAELLRIKSYAAENQNRKVKNEILSLYNQAIAFADENGDLNLRTMSQLGKILTLHQFHDIIQSEQLNEVQKIMTDLSDEAHNHVLSINYACACYVENLLRGGEIDQNQTRYWEKMQYADLAHAAQHGGPVKLTVM